MPGYQEVSVNQNTLFLDGRAMRTDVLVHSPDEIAVSSDQLCSLLERSRVDILDAVAMSGQHLPIWALHLGVERHTQTSRDRIFTNLGRVTAVIESDDGIQAPFRAYWSAIKGSGFLPEVRRTIGKGIGGAWMLLRQPTAMQVSEQWLGYDEPPSLSDLRTMMTGVRSDNFRHLSPLSKRLHVGTIRAVQIEHICKHDQELKKLGVSEAECRTRYSRQHAAAMLAVIAMKQMMEYPTALCDDIEDAKKYILDSDYIDPASKLATLNALH